MTVEMPERLVKRSWELGGEMEDIVEYDQAFERTPGM